MKIPWPRLRKGKGEQTVKSSVFTNVPGFPAIELIAYYKEFLNYYPNCELETKAWFVNNIIKDWVLLDCGANIGYYTILFAKLAPEGHVYAFEPTITYKMLLANLSHHKIENVTPLNLALGKSTGKTEDSIFRIWGREPEKMIYSFTTIDDFVRSNNISHLDCIKIDVDSFDFEVLQGARQTLIKDNPFVVVELNHALNKRNQSVPQALEWLADLGYLSVISLDYENFLLKRDFEFSAEQENKHSITIIFQREK